LTKLASNAGTFDLEQGAALATKVGFANTDSLEIDGNNSFGGTSGGSSLTIGGALTNSNDVTIGNTGLTANTSVIATGALTNNPNATFTLTSGTAHATLKVGGALNNAGFLELDEFSGGNAGSGGSTLTVTGALTNSGTLQVGNGNITRATAATAAKLTNTGTIDLFGGIAANGGSARASLGIGAAAPSVWVGRAELSGNALLKFGSGTIQTIGSGANLSIDGAQAFVANAAKPTSNSALTGLTTNSGSFSLSDGATLALSAFDNSATLAVDGAFPTTSLGGSSLKLSGLLTNGGTLTIGNSSITKAATVTAAGLVNNGAVDLTGGTARATLNIGSPAPGNLSGSFDLEGNALLEFAGGGITTIGGGLTLDGAKALVALSSKLTSNSALSGLNTVSGTFDLEGGAALSLTGGLSNTGRLDVDTSFGQGGSSLTLGGTLITTNFFAIGNSNLSATTKVKVAVLTATGSINISGGIGANTNTATLSLTGASSDGGFMSIGGGGVLVLGSTLTVTSQLLLSGGTVSGGTLAGTGTLTGSQTSTLNHVTIAAGATFTAGFGSTLNDNGVTVNGAMKGGGSATLDFLNHGTLNVTNVSGFPTIGLANGGANNLVLTDANFTSTAGVITITDGDSGNTVDAHTLSSVNAIFVTAGTGTDKLTGGDGDDVFIAGGKTTMTGNAGTNQFRFLAAGSSNVIADFGGSASNELVFSNSGFNLGLSGAGATPQMMTPSEASTLFTANATGKFNNTSQRLAYSTATGKLFASADGSGSSAQLVATLTAHPSIAATQLFFIS
jgi:filamentous hemagglutinin